MIGPAISPGLGFLPREDGDEDVDGREDGDGEIVGWEDGDEDIDLDGIDDGAIVSNMSITLAAASHTFNT